MRNLRYRLYSWRYRLICVGWSGREDGRVGREVWLGRRSFGLPMWCGRLDV